MGARDGLAQVLLRLFPRIIPPAFTLPIYFERRPFPRNRAVRLLYSALGWNYDLVVVERVVEVPFVLRHLPPAPGSKVLDFGCTQSPLPIQLASLGYQVVGVDLRPYPYTHPGFRFLHGDFFQAGFLDHEFDAVVAVSAVEHCGLGAYGEMSGLNDDVRTMREIFRVLRPGGRLLLTVPYGRPGRTSWYRVYDRASLARLLEGFEVDRIEYYVGRERRDWRPGSEVEVADVDSVTPGFTQGVACVVAIKPR
jgi:SAM-dependent methyltransferase